MTTRKIVQYKKLNNELKKLFNKNYKDGINDAVTVFKDPRDQQMHHAVSLELDNIFYLVIVDTLMGRLYNKNVVAEAEDELLKGLMEDGGLNEDDAELFE